MKGSASQAQHSLTGIAVSSDVVAAMCASALTFLFTLQLAVNRNQLDSADSVYKRISVQCCLPCTGCSLGSPV